jgi:hypothetical protein
MSSIAGFLTVDSAIWVSRNCELLECAGVFSVPFGVMLPASLCQVRYCICYSRVYTTSAVQGRVAPVYRNLLLTLPAQKLHAFLARGRSLE